jgi:hypothetical protein
MGGNTHYSLVSPIVPRSPATALRPLFKPCPSPLNRAALELFPSLLLGFRQSFARCFDAVLVSLSLSFAPTPRKPLKYALRVPF